MSFLLTQTTASSSRSAAGSISSGPSDSRAPAHCWFMAFLGCGCWGCLGAGWQDGQLGDTRGELAGKTGTERSKPEGPQGRWESYLLLMGSNGGEPLGCTDGWKGGEALIGEISLGAGFLGKFTDVHLSHWTRQIWMSVDFIESSDLMNLFAFPLSHQIYFHGLPQFTLEMFRSNCSLDIVWSLFFSTLSHRNYLFNSHFLLK